MKEIILSGLVLGLSAGFAPGPLMALVLAQTLRHGTREGCKTALAPLLTDLPVILLSLFFTTQVARLRPLLALISLAGAAFILHLAWESFRPPRLELDDREAPAQSWRKGFLTNLLSPNPWLFWFTVGAATLAKATALSGLAAVVFLCLFYVCLCGTKLVLALVAGRSRAFLTGRTYRLILQALGLVLALFAALLIRDGIGYLAAGK
jgi:threonine/homoserine/homoserine lactone efflux protein